MLRAEHDDLMVTLINSSELGSRVRALHTADGADWHANDAETSLMLSLAPRLVRRELVDAADDPDRTEGLVFAHPVNRTSLNGVTGRPSQASPAKGRELFALMVEELAGLIRRGQSERPPLDHSYFNPVS
jgi:creatinine amidohydrolase